MTFSARGSEFQSLGPDKAEPDQDWQPIPLELPLDDLRRPFQRPPAPAGGEQNPDPDGDVGSHVIIIDLA